MPKKNKTACKRRKCQRSRSQRRRQNNNRRTRTIRGGGLPSCWPSCWRSRSNRVAPTTPSADSPQTRPSYNPHNANASAAAIVQAQQMVRDSHATRQEINHARREQEAAERKSRREQEAEYRRVMQDAEKEMRAAQHAMENAKRVTKRGQDNIAAAQKKHDAAVTKVPNHMRTPSQALSRGVGGPPGS